MGCTFRPTCSTCCPSRDRAPVRWWRRAESESGWPWGWTGEHRAPGTRWSQCRSLCASSSATRKKNNKFIFTEVWDLNLKQSREILFNDKTVQTIKVSLEVKVDGNKIWYCTQVILWISLICQRSFTFPDTRLKVQHKGWASHPYLLFVVGCVRQQSRHMEHELIVLEGRVQGVSARGIRWRKNSKAHCTITAIHLSHTCVCVCSVFSVRDRMQFHPNNDMKWSTVAQC